jgi:hypothetical protein
LVLGSKVEVEVVGSDAGDDVLSQSPKPPRVGESGRTTGSGMPASSTLISSMVDAKWTALGRLNSSSSEDMVRAGEDERVRPLAWELTDVRGDGDARADSELKLPSSRPTTACSDSERMDACR